MNTAALLTYCLCSIAFLTMVARVSFLGGYFLGWAAIFVAIALSISWIAAYRNKNNAFYLVMLSGLIPFASFGMILYMYRFWLLAGYLQMASFAVWSASLAVYSHRDGSRLLEYSCLFFLLLSPVTFLAYFRVTNLWLLLNIPWVSLVMFSFIYYLQNEASILFHVGVLLFTFGIGGGPGVAFLQAIRVPNVGIVVDTIAIIGGILMAIAGTDSSKNAALDKHTLHRGTTRTHSGCP